MDHSLERDLIVSPAWLNQHLNDRTIAIVDVRFQLDDKTYGKTVFAQGHIPGAVQLDLDTDLSGPVGQHRGRHPLPPWSIFVHTMSQNGIAFDQHIVVYDEDGSGAARTWWLLKALGHPHVSLLAGGWKSWQQAFPVSTEAALVKRIASPTPYATQPILPIVSYHDVLHHLHEWQLVDVRHPRRYQGIEEPIDRKGGHIPGAFNYFWQNFTTDPLNFHSPQTLQQHFQELDPKTPTIVYCGSGVTACVGYIALSIAGYHPILYPGSWSDWVSYETSPIETGERMA